VTGHTPRCLRRPITKGTCALDRQPRRGLEISLLSSGFRKAPLDSPSSKRTQLAHLLHAQRDGLQSFFEFSTPSAPLAAPRPRRLVEVNMAMSVDKRVHLLPSEYHVLWPRNCSTSCIPRLKTPVRPSRSGNIDWPRGENLTGDLQIRHCA